MSDRTDNSAPPCPHDCERFGNRVPGYKRGSNWDWVPCWCQDTPMPSPGATSTPREEAPDGDL